MLAIIPLLPLILVSIIFHSISSEQASSSWRASILSASILWGVLLTAITEILSAFNAITPAWVAGLWGMAALLSGYVCIRTVNKAKPVIWFKIPGAFNSEAMVIFGLIAIPALTGIIALFAPPNNWDAMSYHMSRVMHWIQNRNVGHYPTHIMRQLFLQPWAEFAIMHLQILSRGDHFANLVQWFSMIGSLCGVSLIAKDFGADRRTQIFTAVIAVTIPMGILQASGTQNDYVASFWLVCFVYFIMRLIREPGNLTYSIATGSSLGLALLTKGTCYLYALPFLAWFGCACLKKIKAGVLKPFLIIIALILLINGCHFMRNFELFHNPLAQTGEYANSIITFSALFSNTIRNIALHLSTPFGHVNAITKKCVYAIHQYFNIDINDPRTTFMQIGFMSLFVFNENYTGNFIHLLLIAVSIAAFIMNYPKRRESPLLYYCASLICGFLLFCLYLKWQPWHSRLHLPLFVLWAPFIAITLSSLYRANQKLVNLTCFILILVALPWVFKIQSRKLLGDKSIFVMNRIDQYFRYRSYLEGQYIRAAHYLKLKGYSNVGIIVDEDDWEYPFFVLFQDNYPRGFRIEHVNVDNASSVKYGVHPFDNFDPDAIMVLKSYNGKELLNKNVKYKKQWSAKPISIFVKE